MRFTPADLYCARSVFMWAAKMRLLCWRELNALLHNVAHAEARVAQCYGKQKFQTFALAQQIARRNTRRGFHKHAYHCQVCGYAHIGTNNLMGRKSRPRFMDDEVADA